MKARVGIISATGTGQKRLLPAMADSDVCEIAGIHARDPAKGAELAHRYGLPNAHSDAAEMLDSVSPNAVVVASPPFLHPDDVALTAGRGIPTLCEKPLATNLPAAKLIHQTVQAAAIPFGVGHHIRHQAALPHIRALLASGDIGPVRRVEGQWSFGLNRDASNAVWKLDPAKGGETAFYDAGVHVVDLVLHLFGPPLSVQACGLRVRSDQTYDNVAALFEYDAFIATVSASHTMRRAANALVIDGERGRVTVPHAFGEQSIAAVHVVTSRGKSTRTFPPENLYRNEVDDFVRKLHGRSEYPGATLDEALLAMCVLDAIDRSIATKAAVTL